MSEPTLEEAVEWTQSQVHEAETLGPSWEGPGARAALAHLRRIPALEAENARLREALEAIAECSRYTRAGGATVGDLGSYEAGLDEAIALANAALTPPAGPH